MLKHVIIAAAVLAGQVIATDQAPPTTLQHDKRSSHNPFEHSNKLTRRHDDDIAEQIEALAPKCKKICDIYVQEEAKCDAEESKKKVEHCHCAGPFFKEMLKCAACDPALQKLLSLKDQEAAATYIGDCRCHAALPEDLKLDMLPPGNATATELANLQTCPNKKISKNKSTANDTLSEEAETVSSSSTFLTLQILPLTLGMSTAIFAGWYAL